ncbi:guanylate-binding protein 1-like [Mya arenaria]|uniref:guanylate-binding protein 1-like n=1 Tax=Mya arenaria TaxID=6604 RepID=UPI0022E15D0F|nr:guanylate-binding protein 1-like [Mya arenaria]
MSSNENPTDSSAIKEFGTKLKLFERTSKGEPTQTRNPDTPHMKRSGPFQNQVTTERESPSPKTYLTTHDSSVFKKPQCLISAIEANTLKVCDDVLDEISRIDKPCVIVSIAGLYRTGKSYLMNRLAGTQEGFALGDTIESMKKGIWVWCRVHPEQKDTVLILLDTEGWEDIEKGDSNHDNRIFTLATLLCSTLVYNVKGAFDQEAVNKLTILPGFVLALRDFSPKFLKGKGQLKPDEYLEEGLENKLGKSASFNKPRECIRKFFPQDKRKCFAFPVPEDADTLDNLDSLQSQDLWQRFQTVATLFVSYIYRQEPKQLQVSKLVNGPMFATLIRRYVDAFAKGVVSDVDDAFSTVAKIENGRVKDECMDMFRSRINDIQLPLPSKSLDKHFKEARWSALEYMRTNAVQDVANVVEREAQMEMDLLWQQFQSQNKEEIEKHCTKVLSGLSSFSNLQARLQNADYEVLGGHRKFKRDVDMIGLVWSNFASDLRPEEIKILEKDNELSVEEKASSFARVPSAALTAALISATYPYGLTTESALGTDELGKLDAFRSCTSKTDELNKCVSNLSKILFNVHSNLTIVTGGRKRVDSIQGEYSSLRLQLYVDVKGKIPLKEEPFEKCYNNIPVEVLQGTFQLYTNNSATARQDELKIGCQIMGSELDGTTGTLGGFTDHPEYGLCGLTCAHVLLSN